MANEHLSLPTGLSAEDYTLGGGSLLDYTPPNVQWQAPLAQMGENIYANYAKTSPGLLQAYNQRLALPTSATGALPMEGGRPQSMGSWGLQHWKAHPEKQGVTRFLPGDEGYTPGALWSDPGRSPYLGYPGGVRSGGGTTSMAAVGGRLPQPSVEGYEYAYPVLGWQEDAGVGGQYVPGVWGGTRTPEWDYYTQNIDEFPYFPYAPGDIGTPIDGADYISVGQSLLPTSDYPSDRSGWGDVFRYTAGQWF